MTPRFNVYLLWFYFEQLCYHQPGTLWMMLSTQWRAASFEALPAKGRLSQATLQEKLYFQPSKPWTCYLSLLLRLPSLPPWSYLSPSVVEAGASGRMKPSGTKGKPQWRNLKPPPLDLEGTGLAVVANELLVGQRPS